jgi:NodT family efflux transporter outer membrane factor (OMF) lipoprotein
MNYLRMPPQALFISLWLLLGGCTMLGPDFQTPEVQVPETWSEQDSDLFQKPSKDESITWWTQFNDPVLDELIQVAYQQNLSLRSAGLRIMEARAQLGLVKGNLFPQVQNMQGDLFTIGTAGPAADRYYNAASVGFDAAWEMDFWGKFRRSIESADDNLLASVADYDDVLVSLTAEVARTYVNIRTLQERIDLAQKNGELQQNSLKLVILQFEAGTVTELDVLQAKTLLTTTMAAIPNMQATLSTYTNALAVLLGMLPGEINNYLQPMKKIPELSTKIAIGIPAELLRRRPDIRRAEMQTAAQSAQIGIARTELFPSFTLFGSLGWGVTDRGDSNLGNIFDANSFSYSFGPAFKWNLFNYGRLKNQVRIQDARFQQLITGYQDTVLNAAREVEDAMQSLDYTKKEAKLLEQGVATSKKSTDLSMIQYKEGLADYQRVLDSTRALTQKQDQYAQTKGRIATSIIALYKALGGGWQIRKGKEYLPQEVKETMEKRTDWGNLLNDTPTGGE